MVFFETFFIYFSSTTTFSDTSSSFAFVFVLLFMSFSLFLSLSLSLSVPSSHRTPENLLLILLAWKSLI